MKSTSQHNKELRARRKAEGLVEYRRWLHPDLVALLDRLIEIAKQIGGGNVSKGLRRALESFKQTKEGNGE